MERNERSRPGCRARKHGRSWGGPVEKLPLEVIGDILSRVGVARDVIRVSLTCRSWREAYRRHLHTLSFDVADDDRVYRELPTSDLEMLITKTIFQSPGLRKLSILMDEKHEFSGCSVVGWLMYCRETLLELSYMVRTYPSIDVLEICGRQKLETLCLWEYNIREVDPSFQRFPCLTSLSLSRVRVLVEDLNSLLLAFTKLKSLELSKTNFFLSLDDEVGSEETIKLHCPTFKYLFLNHLEEFNFVLENNGIELLHVKDCKFSSFKVNGSRSLRHFNISCSEFRLLKIEEGDNLETFEIINSHVTLSNLFPLTIQAPKLKTFRIWGMNYRSTCFYTEEEIIFDEPWLVVDFDQMAVCSPQLSHLSIFHDDGGSCDYKFGGLHSLENVEILEIGWDDFDFFWEWTEKVLKCCPNVRKLIVHGMVAEEKNQGYLNDFAEHTLSMVGMMRKYQHIEVQFVYTYRSEFRNYPPLDAQIV